MTPKAVRGPRLVFDEPYVRAGVPFRDATDRGNVVHTSSFAIVALRNEGDEEARDVVVWLSFESLDGRRLSNNAKAHWADQQDARQRSIDIPANRDPHAIDVVMKVTNERVCWVYDDDSERQLRREGHEITEREFLIKLVAHSSNAPDVAADVCVRHGGQGTALEICPEVASSTLPLTEDQKYWREQIISLGYLLIGRAERTREDEATFAGLKADVHNYARKMRGIVIGKFPTQARALLSDSQEDEMLEHGGCGDFITVVRSYVALFSDQSETRWTDDGLGGERR